MYVIIFLFVLFLFEKKNWILCEWLIVSGREQPSRIELLIMAKGYNIKVMQMSSCLIIVNNPLMFSDEQNENMPWTSSVNFYWSSQFQNECMFSVFVISFLIYTIPCFISNIYNKLWIAFLVIYFGINVPTVTQLTKLVV